MVKAIRYTIIILCITTFFLLLNCRKKEGEKQSTDTSNSVKRDVVSNGGTEESKDDQLILKLVGPDSNPVAGAKVGTGYGTWVRPHGTTILWGLGGRRIRPDGTPGAVSDEEGIVRLSASKVFRNYFRQRTPIYARQDQRYLVALTLVESNELDQPKNIKMEPACLVHGVVQSQELTELGQPLHDVHTNLSWEGIRGLAITYISEGPYQFYLPSGKYYSLKHWGASVSGARTHRQSQNLTIPSGKQKMDIGVIDLPATKLATLVGKPAPELQNIKEWGNGGPMKLADLRGKIVVLSFWSYHCGPSVYEIGMLIDLYDKLKGEDMVIIAVHDNSVSTIEEMDKKIEFGRREILSGRDIPFIIALDNGGETLIEGTNKTTRGATSAAYGIQEHPTTLVIDRDGKIAKHINHSHGGSLELIVQRMLGLLPDEWKPWLTSECEGCDVDRYYRNQRANKESAK
jgi:thiol-disulfide isomerase/thioredoxin